MEELPFLHCRVCCTLTCACERAQLFRSAFSAAMCGALASVQSVPRVFGPVRLWPIYAVRGIPGAASMVFYYQAIAMLPLSDAVRDFVMTPLST